MRNLNPSKCYPPQIKGLAAEEKRIQQQILVQQKKELTTFLDTQKKQYRLCRDRMKEVGAVQTKHSSHLLLFPNSQAITHQVPYQIFRKAKADWLSKTG